MSVAEQRRAQGIQLKVQGMQETPAAENMPLGARTSGAQPGGRLQRKTETGGRLQRGMVVVWSFELRDGVDDEAVVTAPNEYRMGRRVAFWVPLRVLHSSSCIRDGPKA